MTDSDGVQFLVNAEVGSKRSLHARLETLDGQTESNGDVVDHRLQSVTFLDGTIKGWPGQELELLLAERDVDVLDFEPVEVVTDSFGYIVRTGSGERIGQHTDPDSRVADETIAVLNRRDGCDFVVFADVKYLILRIVALLLLLVVVDHLAWPLVEPRESNKVDSGGFDILFVE